MYTLHLSRYDFWESTPRQIVAMLRIARKRAIEESRAENKLAYHRTGILATVIAKSMGSKKQIRPTDFIPKELQPKPSWQRMLGIAQAITSRLSGKQ